MKKLLTILFLSVIALLSQQGKDISELSVKQEFFTGSTDKYIYLLGEYTAGIINVSTQRYYNIAGVATLDATLASINIVGGVGGPHSICAFSDIGEVYCKGDNSSGCLGDGTLTDRVNFTKITQDSLGNAFNGIVEMCMSSTATGWVTAARKSDGTVWIWGKTDQDMRGNGTAGGQTTRPVQIMFPSGVLIAKIQIGFMGMAMATNGDVYCWGAHIGFYSPYLMAQCTATPITNVPTKVTLAHPAIDIACNGQTALVLTAQAMGSGQLYGWAYEAGSIGVGAALDPNPQHPDAGGASLCPWPLDSAYSTYLPSGVQFKKIYSGSVCNYFISSDSNMYMQGDNANGGAGDGVMINWRTYSGANGWDPWNWDQNYGQLLYRKIRQIAIGEHDWVDVFTGPALVYNFVAETYSGRLCFAGRNKGEVIGNNLGGIDSIGQELESVYPNNKNVSVLTWIWPFKTFSHITRVTARLFTDSMGQYYSTYPPNLTGAPPIPTVSGNTTFAQGTTVTMIGNPNVTSPARATTQTWWTYESGSGANIPVPGSDTLVLLNAKQGIHSVRYHVEDDHFKIGTTLIYFTVGCANCQIRPKVGKHNKRNV